MLKNTFNDVSSAADLFEGALEDGNIALCIKMLRAGCGLKMDSDLHKSAYLHRALELRSLEMLKAFDERGIHPRDALVERRKPSLFEKESKRSTPALDIIKWLLEKGVPVGAMTAANIVQKSGDLKCLDAVMAAKDFHRPGIPFLVDQALNHGRVHMLEPLIMRENTVDCVGRIRQFMILYQENGSSHSDHIWDEISEIFKKWNDALQVNITLDLDGADISELTAVDENGVSPLDCLIAQDRVEELFNIKRGVMFINAIRDAVPHEKRKSIDFDRIYKRSLLRGNRRRTPKLK